jgi:predicted DNA-binding transcriptional regulator YafY
VALLVNSRVMAEKMTERMAVKKRTLERYIAELQKCGILKREGGKKNKTNIHLTEYFKNISN